MKELAAVDVSKDMKGRLQRLYNRCFTVDLLTPIASSDALLRIHSTAEDYRAPAEETAFIPFQVTSKFT